MNCENIPKSHYFFRIRLLAAAALALCAAASICRPDQVPSAVAATALSNVKKIPDNSTVGTQWANDLARARVLVGKMTLAEKIEELHGEGTNRHFRHIVGIPRLGIPELRLANGCVGVGPADDNPQKKATALPCEIALAATWDTALARRYGKLIGREARDLKYGMVEGPDINIARVPQCGRTFEAFGEDPFLTACMAVADVRGIQSQNVIAEVKHFDANNQETDRGELDEIIPLRALHEIYFPAFKAAVQQAHVGAVMGAYPKVNGVFCCQNRYLLHYTLRDRWHFPGFVTSDFGATHSTVASALNGLDVEMPKGHYFARPLAAAVRTGQVPIRVIDRKLVRRFATMMRFHLFSNPPTRHAISVRRDGRIALRIAERGIVLLKDKGGILPLNATVLKSLAVIGPYAVRASTGGGGSSNVVPLYTVAPLSGIRRLAGVGVRIRFNNGSNIEQAVRIARACQVAIVMVGDYETEGRDFPLSLEGNQNQLVEAVAAANPHTVVVLKTGSARLLPWAKKVPAILEAWYPGEEDGNAVAAILFGQVDPCGKLPITFPRSPAQLPAHTAAEYPGLPVKPHGPLVVHYNEGVFVGYRYYQAHDFRPLFPFGYGLSYTTFTFHDLRITPPTSESTGDGALTVAFNVTNTGQRAGAEVAQLYLGYPSSKAIPEPPEQLRGFSRVNLHPGQTRRVVLTVPIKYLRYWSQVRNSWQLLPGIYHIYVGDSSSNLPLRGVMTFSPSSRLPP